MINDFENFLTYFQEEEPGSFLFDLPSSPRSPLDVTNCFFEDEVLEVSQLVSA